MKPFYITTPIYYVNDLPHIGHIYSTVVADASARYRRMEGRPVRFLTGTDEHGQNIERIARERGIPEIQLADQVVGRYQELWKTFGITNDDFIRTTEKRHTEGVFELIRRIEAAGDLYLARHEGWYCMRCEAYYTEKELLEGKLCPDHSVAVAWQSEENVFFRLSRYQQPLLDLYARNPGFVRPETRRNEVVSFVASGLKDLSVSRSNISWGIPFPGHPGHVVYVWLDALTNYVSALGFGSGDQTLYERFWAPPEAERIHLVGKDIVRFHAVYWPAFLMSAGLPVPTTVWAHGWWLRDARKMSKSVGNVVRPDALVARFGADALRYFLLREMTFGADAQFSDEAFLGRYNADLANDLGNTVSRVAALLRQSFGATPPLPHQDNEVRRAAEAAVGEWRAAMEEFAFSRALESCWRLLAAINGYVVAQEPWKIRKEEGNSPRLSRVLYAAAEGARLAGVLLFPAMPSAALKIFAALGAPAAPPSREDLTWGRLPLSHPVPDAPALFPRVDAADYFSESPGNKEVAMSDPTGGVSAGTSAALGGERVSIEEFGRLDLRVAKIAAAERVPKSKKLMRLEIDLGSERRQIVAGIATRYQPEELIGRRIVVVANLKPATLMGVESNGMVLAATLPDTGEPVLLSVGEEAPPGSKVK
jgi:methionyl-tRNA synthetase